MNRLEEIKERLNKAEGYVGDGITDNTPLVNARLDIQYLLQRLERYEEALKEANTIIHDYKEVRGYRERQVHEITDIIKQALKE